METDPYNTAPDENVMPYRIAALPRHRGYPVPFFVEKVNGEYDFRIVRAGHVEWCVKFDRCWICGRPLRGDRTFVIGPMCVVNRKSAEPPSHHECATYAAKTCPFLAMPHMKRREVDEDKMKTKDAPGIMIKRNPGVCVLWPVKKYSFFPCGGGILIDVGEPIRAPEWWREARLATREECEHSITTGLCSLEERCTTDDERRVLQEMVQDAKQFLPTL